MQRRAISVSGMVQGVGFRPFVFGLASRLGLAGFVRNEGGGVLIEVEGMSRDLDAFCEKLVANAPPLARLEGVSSRLVSLRGSNRFEIHESEVHSMADVFISPDLATCDDCRKELFTPSDRRYRYPFINCTNCGPRLTIVLGVPYDRPQTTMNSFAMCGACRAEYEDPRDRRFHAQPIACPNCGPQLQLHDERAEPIEASDPVTSFAQAILQGRIGALKGIGGFHLVCDATNRAAVERLRLRKGREEKPFTIMLRVLSAVASICEMTGVEGALLGSRAAPIVLLRRGPETSVADAVAPGNQHFGVMLPYTPLHHLLMEAVAGVPLVMTSGNRADEPIARDNEEAVEQLRGIADLFLTHNRPIYVRCDDSVTRVIAGEEAPIRRSRGYAPLPIRLPLKCPRRILAVGGQLKGTFALGRDQQAFLSHHLGDLDHHQAYLAFQRDIGLYQKLFHFEPEYVVHDLHPDYASTGFAQQTGLPLIAVQHHHAHMASCMAENGLTGPAIGVTFDGLGYGADGAVWGGEFLVGDFAGFRRVGHLRYVGMPGGDQATRQPWRMAAAHLRDAQVTCPVFESRVSRVDRRVVNQMLERGFNTPLTSSVGRLFDAVAALTGVRDRVSFEGQAAMELEWLATDLPPAGSYPFGLESPGSSEPFQIDTRPTIGAVVLDLANKITAEVMARRFHSTVVELIRAACARVRQQTGLSSVVLSGGVFLNALLTGEVLARLTADDFTVYRHRLVPPNDAGLSLGQVAIAAEHLRTQPTAATTTSSCV